MRILSIGTDTRAFDPASATGKRLASYGSVVETYAVIARTEDPRAHDVKLSPNVPVYAAYAPHPLLFPFSAICAAWRARREGAFDAITAENPFDVGLAGYVISRIFRIPLHLQIHGDFFSSDAWLAERGSNQMRRRLAIWLVRRAAGVRVVSERVRKSVLALGVAPGRVQVVPISSDDATVRPRENPRRDSPHILFVGRLEAEKNPLLLIRAFALVRARVPGVTLRIVGSGSLERSLHRAADDLGVKDSVQFVPWLDDLSLEYAAANVLAVPSNHEGWGRVAPEAALAHLPVVMTDVGCAGEYVRDGETGWVVPVGDTTALSDAIVAALTNPDEATRRANALAAIPRFTSEEYRGRLADSWRAALQPRRRLLVVTQVVDEDDSNLGFFVEWLRAFAAHADSLTVLAHRVGRHTLPPHVRVVAVGPAPKMVRYVRLVLRALREMMRHDAAFTHMAPEFALILGPLARLFGRRFGMFYAHGRVSWRLRAALRFLDTAFTSSPEGFRVPFARLRIIGQGIDTVRFRPADARPVAPPLRLLAVGRISPAKGLDVIIRALSAIRASGKAATLTVVGSAYLPEDQAYKIRCQELARELQLTDAIVWRGSVAYRDLPDVYRSHHALLHASTTGSFDKVVLEALASGLSVFSSAPTYRTLIPAAWQFTQGDASALAMAVASHAHEPAPSELRERVTREHGLARFIGIIAEDLFEEEGMESSTTTVPTIPATAVILTYNSAATLGATLASISPFAEKLVVDGGSTDATLAIAAAAGCRVISQRDDSSTGPIADFAAVRNRAVAAATNDWIFMIDSDEEATPRLLASIRATASSVPAAFWVSRRYVVSGVTIHRATTYPNRQPRFFHRAVFDRYENRAHERAIFSSATIPKNLDGWIRVPLPSATELRRKWAWQARLLVSGIEPLPFARARSLFIREALLALRHVIRACVAAVRHLPHSLPPRYEFGRLTYYRALLGSLVRRALDLDRRDAIVVGVALAAHAGAFLVFLARFDTPHPWGWFLYGSDDLQYLTLGRNLWHGIFSLSDAAPFLPDSSRTPIYPFFLMLGRFLPGAVLIALQGLFATLGIWFWYRFARRLFGARLAFWSAILFSLDPIPLFWTTQFTTEAIFSVFWFGSLLALARFLDRPRAVAAAGAGILTGLALLTRPIVIAYPAVVALIIVVALRRTPRAALAGIASFAIAVAFVAFPWVARNYRVFGVPTLSSAGAGIQFGENGPTYVMWQQHVTRSEAGAILRRRLGHEDLIPALDDKEKMRVVNELFFRDPVGYAYVMALNAIPYFFGDGYATILQTFIPTLQPPALRWDGSITGYVQQYALELRRTGSAAPFLVFGRAVAVLTALLAAAGAMLLLADPKRRPAAFWLILTLLYFAAVSGTIAYSRYRYPIQPMLYLFAVAVLNYVIRPSLLQRGSGRELPIASLRGGTTKQSQ